LDRIDDVLVIRLDVEVIEVPEREVDRVRFEPFDEVRVPRPPRGPDDARGHEPMPTVQSQDCRANGSKEFPALPSVRHPPAPARRPSEACDLGSDDIAPVVAPERGPALPLNG